MSDQPTNDEPAPLSPEANEEQPPERKSRRRSRGIWSSLAFIVIVMLINALVQLDYFVISPGSAVNVAKFTDIPAEKSFPPNGEVLLTTVSFVHAHPSDIFWAWITPDNQIESKKEALGTSTPQQYLQANQEAMDDSQLTAISVAMRRAGYPVKQLGDGAIVTAVGPDTPAAGKLQPGDVILTADGKDVRIASDVSAYVRELPPGAIVKLHVVAQDGVRRDVEVATAPRPDGQAGVYIGVLIQTKNARLDTDFPVKFKETKIGGPSAGLAFTLALLDQLTPGDLTGGKSIATTGTISGDGRVGPVGGVKQKARAVSRTKAKLFLVPSAEVEDARSSADKDVKIVPVDDLEQALQALKDNGGDVSGVPPVTAPKPGP